MPRIVAHSTVKTDISRVQVHRCRTSGMRVRTHTCTAAGETVALQKNTCDNMPISLQYTVAHTAAHICLYFSLTLSSGFKLIIIYSDVERGVFPSRKYASRSNLFIRNTKFSCDRKEHNTHITHQITKTQIKNVYSKNCQQTRDTFQTLLVY